MSRFKLFKSNICLTLCLILLMLIFASCAGNEEIPPDDDNVFASSGIYCETDVSIPGLSGVPADVKISDDGSLEIITKHTHPQLAIDMFTLYTAQINDTDLALEEKNSFDVFYKGYSELLLGEEPKEYWRIINAIILPSHEYLITVSKYDEPSNSSSFEYYIVDEQGGYKLLENGLTAFLSELNKNNQSSEGIYLKALSQERIFIEYYDYENNQEVRAVHNFTSGEEIFRLDYDAKNKWYYHDNAIITCDKNGNVTAKSIENGKKLNVPAFANNENGIYSAFTAYNPLSAITPEGNFLQGNDDGFTMYTKTDELAVPAFHTDIYRLFSPRYKPYCFYYLGNGRYLALFGSSSGTLKAAVYEYDENTLAEITTEIEIYSLYELINMPEIINEYRYTYPNVQVNYTFALPAINEFDTTADRTAQAVEEQDAIRTLNARLLNSTGPDVIILDGLPIQSYLENDLLYDISGIYSADLFEQSIIEPMRHTDNALYYIPTRFSLPVIIGDANYFKGINSHDTLYSAVESLHNTNSEISPVSINSPAELINCLYAVNQPALFEKVPSKENIALFLNMAANLQSFSQPNNGPTISFSPNTDNPLAYGLGLTPSFYYYSEGNSYSAIGILNSCKVLDSIAGTMYWRGLFKENGAFYGQSHKVFLFPSMQQSTYLPKQIAGVYSPSEQIPAATNFIEVMLSHDMQLLDLGTGFPVRTQTLSSIIENYNAPPMLHLTNSGFQKISFDIRDILNNLEQPVIEDNYLRSSIIMAYTQYYYELIDIDEAIDMIEENTRLFFAEK